MSTGKGDKIVRNLAVSVKVPVPDARYDYLCEFHKPASKVPAFLNVTDIAGLVKGAAEGQGLGNAFLSHIKACDALFHLTRTSSTSKAAYDKLEKLAVRGRRQKAQARVRHHLQSRSCSRRTRARALSIEVLNKHLLISSKPMIYLVNLSEKDYIRRKNKWLVKIKEWIDANDPGAICIPFSGVFELKLAEMEPEERANYLKENNLTSALDKIILQGYKALQLQYFFTAGPDEVKAWTIQKGTKAPQAAGKIHTDFERGFVMAEVMKFDDFKEEGSEAGAKAAGKYHQRGRTYVVEDGDIIFFKFNTGGLKKK
ncbi:putative obg-like ATPase 1 isoform X5 [Penaeus vannamei]|uniref:Putative obg-like ATPase 1 isoform X5 n=1 Tax=Penaeus vannamei TaxID=6689 RepID=A0A423SV48_PENVA|nr:putative obg-like ATPase 1 isoform X5 [Penaeus vannamei]